MRELQSFSELFQNKLFRIPDYQRGYAWQNSQLVDFWEDIVNLQDGRYHYTGMLSLRSVPIAELESLGDDAWLLNSGYKAYHVVDGQQRLTTFSILVNEIISFVKGLPSNMDKGEDEIVLSYQTLKSIREKYISKKRPPQNLITSYLFGYESDNPSAEYLIYKVYGEPFSGTVNETYYTQNLKYAKEFFGKCIETLYESEGIEGIEKVFQKITLQLMFNSMEIKDDYDVFVAFETMNNRGKKLTNLELLKNRLIYITTLYDDSELDEMDKAKLRDQINDAWKEIYFQLGRNPNSPLSDNDFLREHWIIYFQFAQRRGEDYITFLLNMFSAQSIYAKQTVKVKEKDINLIERESEELNGDPTRIEDIEIIKWISQLKPKEIAAYVNSMKDVAKYWYYSHFPNESGFSYEEKIGLERLNRIRLGHFRPLVTAALTLEHKSATEERVVLFQSIEGFIFLAFRMGGYNATYQRGVSYRKAHEIYTGESTLSEVRNHFSKMKNINMKEATNGFLTRISKWFSSGEGFYAWRDLRYLLYEYEYEKAVETGVVKLEWTPFTRVEKDRVTIEHILPQAPTKWYWRNQFRQYTDTEINYFQLHWEICCLCRKV